MSAKRKESSKKVENYINKEKLPHLCEFIHYSILEHAITFKLDVEISSWHGMENQCHLLGQKIQLSITSFDFHK